MADVPKQNASGIVDRDTRMGREIEARETRMATGSDPRGGDTHTNKYQAKVVGEEAVGGQNPTPDNDLVDDMAASAGVELADSEAVRVREKVAERDDRRWELDRDSAEDFS